MAIQKQWFVLQTMSGQENKAKTNMERRLQVEEMEELIAKVEIPTEVVSEVKDGKKREIVRKFFPGYILAELALYDEEKNLIERTWNFVKETPGIIGFAGGDRPLPLRDDEVNSVMYQVEEKQEKVVPKVLYEIGETIKITDGPFMNFNGEIDEVDPDRGRLKVSVSIFGRNTPVELEYWQVEKV